MAEKMAYLHHYWIQGAFYAKNISGARRFTNFLGFIS